MDGLIRRITTQNPISTRRSDNRQRGGHEDLTKLLRPNKGHVEIGACISTIRRAFCDFL